MPDHMDCREAGMITVDAWRFCENLAKFGPS